MLVIQARIDAHRSGLRTAGRSTGHCHRRGFKNQTALLGGKVVDGWHLQTEQFSALPRTWVSMMMKVQQCQAKRRPDAAALAADPAAALAAAEPPADAALAAAAPAAAAAAEEAPACGEQVPLMYGRRRFEQGRAGSNCEP